MYDLSKAILFDTVDLNDVFFNSNQLIGNQIDSFDPDDVDIAQFREKRSQASGIDVGPVFAGGRRIQVQGATYDVTRSQTLDRYRALRALFAPYVAYRRTPQYKGFGLLTGSINTASEDFDGEILLAVRAMPMGLHAPFQRDNMGGSPQIKEGLGIPWSVTFLMRDPSFHGASPVQVSTAVEVSDLLTHRGNDYSPVNITFTVDPDSSGDITFVIGGSTLVISLPTSSGGRLIEYVGEDKVLWVTEDGGERTLRMSWFDFPFNTTHPLVPPGITPYTVEIDDEISLSSDIIIEYDELYA